MTVFDALDLARCDAELAERLDRLAAEAHASRVACSFDDRADDDEPEPARIGDVIGLDDAEDEPAEARTTIERRNVNLDPRARDVLRMRFHDDLEQWDIAPAIGCSPVQVSRFIRTSHERLSARASVGCGTSSVGDTTEGATA